MADKGVFVPKNPEKYLGNNIKNICFRSSWELSLMLVLDQNPSVLGWMSEALPTNHVHTGISGIPYRNPLTGKWTIYVPDFFVIYIDKNNKKHVEIMEVKPMDEVPPAISGVHAKVSKMKQARQLINGAKFAAGLAFCIERGWKFRIMTEKDLFGRKK